MQSITSEELNDYIVTAPTLTGVKLPPAKEWKRIDVGSLETYVGDDLYVICVVDYKPADVKAMAENSMKAEAAAIAYLQGEGFIGQRYFFVGLQTLELDHLFEM